MKSRTSQLIIAVVILVVAFIGNKVYLDQKEKELSPSRIVKVFVAKKPIPAGTTITSSLIEKRDVPENFRPVSAVSNLDQIEGAEIGVSVPAGDYILETYFFSRQSTGKTLSEQIEGENARAITIPVDETNSLSRSVVSGDRIDIVLTFQVPKLNQKVSTVLFQNVRVIATGSYSVYEEEVSSRGGAARRYNALTLQLTADEALRLNYAREVGKISILLRNRKDNGMLDMAPIGRVTDFLSGKEKDLIESWVSSAAQPNVDVDKFKSQLREVLDQKRLQTSR